MPPPSEPSDIEFLDDPASADDGFEELPPEPPRPRWRPARVLIAVILGLAAAALVAVRVLPSGHGLGHEHRVLTVTAPSGSVVITGSGTVAPINPRTCPDTETCVATALVPTPVLAAVRTYFPGARLISATDVLIHRGAGAPALRYRTLTARAGAITVVVEVRQPSDHDQLNSIKLGGTKARPSLITLVHSGAFTVAVTVTNDRIPVRIQAVSTLAGDRRLLAVG